nr:unnamed protein product [Callosobruchus analis]
MHSAIETAQKYVPVYTMHDWLTIFWMARTCRSKKKPYNVEESEYSDFLDFEQLSKCLIKNKQTNTSAEKPGVLQYRYDHTSEYKDMLVLGKAKCRPCNISETKILKAYARLRPISVLKEKRPVKLMQRR